MKFYISITVNHPRGETDYNSIESNDLNLTFARVLEQHPSATSVVLCIVPNKDGPATFDR
jgi:hypothetical protein